MNMQPNSLKFSTSLHECTILVVDDDQRQIQSLQKLLASKGYQVDTALGGIAACEKLIEHEYDLTLLDLNMDDFSGHEVMAFMAESNMPTEIIVVSGNTSFNAVSKALRRGACDFIRKPYGIEELLVTIHNVIEKKQLEKAHLAMQTNLLKSEALHRYIVNSSPDIVFMLDKKGNFSFLNNKIEKLLGYPKKELLGQNFSTLLSNQEYHSAKDLLSDNNSNSIETRQIELKIFPNGKDTNPRHFEVSVFPVTRNNNQRNNKQKTPKNQNHEKEVVGTYGTARDITEQKEAMEFINFQAYHDLLTRLPNRALFKDRLTLAISQAKRKDQSLAVMFLDLDRFKIINDTLGHAMGDRLLQSVACRLEKCLREGDTLARFGGDEFTLLLPEINDKESARNIAKKVIQVLREPFHLANHEVFVGVSIGVALYPKNGIEVEQLLQNADLAMYHVKHRGKDGYQFYTPDMSYNGGNRLQKESDMRKALENNEFRVHYQPQINTETGSIIGIEALIRWFHPEKGIIYPADFIPLAEETRLISELSDWVVKTACVEVREWIKQGHQSLRLSINISPTQAEHPRFVPMLLSQLDTHLFPLKNLEIELTENIIMNDLENMIKKLSRLSEKGISIAVDDFGTGYSSLNYLHKLPIHTLKVDQSFIQGIQEEGDDSCIVNAIVAMAHGLHLNIVAEGVETFDQLNYMKKIGCQEIQGFYFGRAVDGQTMLQHLNESALSHQSIA